MYFIVSSLKNSSRFREIAVFKNFLFWDNYRFSYLRFSYCRFSYVRNNTERVHVTIAWFPSMVTSCIIMVQSHNQEINMDTIQKSFSVLCLCVFRYLVLCSFITCVVLCDHCQSRYNTVPWQRALLLPFYRHSHPLPPLLPLPWQLLISLLYINGLI